MSSTTTGGGTPPMNAQTVLQALAVLHGEDSNHQQRQQANQYCEQVKSHPESCLPICLQILQLPPNSLAPQPLATARHFALHGLQHLIGTNWNKLGEEEKKYIKQQAITIVENAGPLTGGVRFLKQTIARILTDIALREWPQHWPDMMEVLFRVANSSADGTELLALFFRDLAQEVTSADPVLPALRRQEVQQSLMTGLDQIIPFLLRSLKEGMQRYSQDKSNTQLLNPCKAVIEAIHALLDWIPAKYVFETGLVQELCAYLVHPDLFEQLCECLSSITNRKSSTLESTYSPQLLLIWDSALNWIQSIQSSNKFAKQTDYLMRLVNILNNLTKSHLPLLQPQEYDSVKQKYLSILGSLLSHPFQKIALLSLDQWVHIFRHGTHLIPDTLRTNLLTELLKLTCFRLMKIDAEGYEEQDMESVEEYNTFFSNFRGALLQLINLMAEMDLKLCFSVARMRYEQLLSSPKPTDHLNADGWVSTRTSRFLELEAVGALLEGLFRCSTIEKFQSDPSLYQIMEGLLRLVLNWQVEDPLLQTRRAHVLGMFGPILEVSSSNEATALFQATIEALIQGVTFRPAMYAEVPFTSLTEDLKACRRRAIVSLTQLSRRKILIQRYFLPLFSQLVQTILSLLQQKRIAQVEKIALFEPLVTISQYLTNPQDQTAFLKNVLDEPLQNWTGAQMNSVLEYNSAAQGVTPFLQLIGLNPEDQQALANGPRLPPTHRTPSKELRSSIRFILHTFMAVFKPLFVVGNSGATAVTTPTTPLSPTSPSSATLSEAAQSAALNILPLILPNLLKLLGHIYSIRSPQVRSVIPANMTGIYAPTADQLLHPEASTMATASVPPPKHYHLVWDVRRWMDRVTDSGMTILMLATKSGQKYYEALAHPQMQSLYISCIYSNLAHMHLREVRTFLDKYLESSFNLCPPAYYQQVFIGQNEQNGVNNVLANVLQVLHQRIKQGWDRDQAAKSGVKNNSLGSPSSTSLSEEIHEESELRELGTCVSDNISKTIELQYIALHAAHVAQTAAETAALASQLAQLSGRELEREKERRDKERKQVEANLLLQVPFVQFIFTQDLILNSLMNLLNYLVTVPDSNSSVKSIRLLHRILPVAIGSRNPLAVQLFAQTFQSGLQILSTGKQQLLDSISNELNAMMKDIYVSLVLANLSLIPRQALLSIPGVDPTNITSLEAVLNTTCAEKKYRSAMRSLLDRAIKQPRVHAQQSILASRSGTELAALTNPLELLQANQHAHTSGRIGQVENLKERVVLPQRPTNIAPADISGVSQLFSS